MGDATGEYRMIKKAIADAWHPSSGGIDLGADEAHIWRVSPNQDAETIASVEER